MNSIKPYCDQWVTGVHDNAVLDEIKKMTVSSDCSLNRWTLDDDEFVDLCW